MSNLDKLEQDIFDRFTDCAATGFGSCGHDGLNVFMSVGKQSFKVFDHPADSVIHSDSRRRMLAKAIARIHRELNDE